MAEWLPIFESVVADFRARLLVDEPFGRHEWRNHPALRPQGYDSDPPTTEFPPQREES